jgi:hypothetical protein
VTADQIGIIAPYQNQCGVLRRLLPRDVFVGTIDSFQGQERAIIILSLVRNNSVNAHGFWSEERRLNVALTRCMKGLIVVGNAAFWKASTSHFFSLLTKCLSESLVVDASFNVLRSLPDSKVTPSSTTSRRASTSSRPAKIDVETSSVRKFVRPCWTVLSDDDRKELLDSIATALYEIVNDPCFLVILEYMMALEEKSYGADRPADWKLWDQEGLESSL